MGLSVMGLWAHKPELKPACKQLAFVTRPGMGVTISPGRSAAMPARAHTRGVCRANSHVSPASHTVRICRQAQLSLAQPGAQQLERAKAWMSLTCSAQLKHIPAGPHAHDGTQSH